METKDLTNILDIMTNLVSGNRKIDQQSPEVRDFKAATSRLIERLVANAPRDHGPDTAFKAIKDQR